MCALTGSDMEVDWPFELKIDLKKHKTDEHLRSQNNNSKHTQNLPL